MSEVVSSGPDRSGRRTEDDASRQMHEEDQLIECTVTVSAAGGGGGPAGAAAPARVLANATAFRAGDVFSADGRNASIRLVLYDAPQLVVREDAVYAAPR